MIQDFGNDVNFGLINDLEGEPIEECRGVDRFDVSPRNLYVLNETLLATAATGTYYKLLNRKWFRVGVSNNKTYIMM